MNQPYIAAGERLTCAAGHPLYAAARDIARSEPVGAGQLRPLRDDVPARPFVDAPYPGACPVCGAATVRISADLGLAVRLERGWSDDDDAATNGREPAAQRAA